MSYDFIVRARDEARDLDLAKARRIISQMPCVWPNGPDGYVCSWDTRTGAGVDPQTFQEGQSVPDHVGVFEIDLAKRSEGEDDEPPMGAHVGLCISYGGIAAALDRCLEMGLSLARELDGELHDLQSEEIVTADDLDRKKRLILQESEATRAKLARWLEKSGDVDPQERVLIGIPPRQSRLPWVWILFIGLVLIWIALKLFYRS
jgi:hypothetical protein